jgi:nucleotide-binding universal stress UspA family protein
VKRGRDSSFRDGPDGAGRQPPWLVVTPGGSPRRPEGEIRRIGCGFDGGTPSTVALRTAARLASELQAELEVIRAIGAPSPVIHRVVSEELAATALAQLRHALALLPDRADAQGIVVQDRDPVRAITSRSDALDLLVLGTRSGSPPGAAVLGPISAQVVDAARCPVLVVPLGVEPPVASLLNTWL